MPYGGDPVKQLGPYVLKSCGLIALGAVLVLAGCGVLVGMAFG